MPASVFSRNIIQRFSSTAESVETTSDVATESPTTMTAAEKLAAMRSKMAESGVDGEKNIKERLYCVYHVHILSFFVSPSFLDFVHILCLHSLSGTIR